MSEIERYASHLGMRRDDLRGTRILDVGSGYGGFAKECIESGIADVVSVEPDQTCFGIRGGEFGIQTSESKSYLSSMVCARAETLPFRDETFDLVIAHFSVPMLCVREEVVRTVFDEMCRVVKRGGEIRIVPIAIGGMDMDEKLQGWIDEKLAQISRDVRYDCMRDKARVCSPEFPGRTAEYPFCVIKKKP